MRAGVNKWYKIVLREGNRFEHPNKILSIRVEGTSISAQKTV